MTIHRLSIDLTTDLHLYGIDSFEMIGIEKGVALEMI